MRHSKWRQNKIENMVYFQLWFYYQTTTESMSKKEGTDVLAVLPTGYYKTILYTITTLLDKFNVVTIWK